MTTLVCSCAFETADPRSTFACCSRTGIRTHPMCLSTGISYLVSKTIATVINKQIIREKNYTFLIRRNCTRYARANMHHGRHPKSASLQSRFGNKTDNPNQISRHSTWAQHIYKSIESLTIRQHSLSFGLFEVNREMSWTARFLGHLPNIHNHVHFLHAA
jgi:hypothetical protein